MICCNKKNHQSDTCEYCRKRKPLLCEDATCKYCINKTLQSIPHIVKKWSRQNKLQPRSILKTSSSKFFLTCECGREYEQMARNMKKNCSVCNNKTEAKLYEYLRSKYNVTAQIKFEWSKNFTYDFCVEMNGHENVLIELDGKQHFSPKAHWKTNWETMNNDVEKEKLAVAHHFFVIRMLQQDVWEDRDDWKKVLDDQLREVCTLSECCVIVPDKKEYKEGIYNRLRQDSFF